MKTNNISISFLGDISLNNSYNELYDQGINPFSNISEYLKNSNITVGNLECMAKGDHGENQLKKPRLKTNLKTLNYLNNIYLDLALLANNHVYDNLEDGFIKTIEFLDENNIAHIGAGLSVDESRKPYIKNIGSKKIGILNYVTHDTNPNLPYNSSLYLNWFEKKRGISDIKKYKKICDFVILYLHWGGRCEGGYYPDWDQPILSRKLIDAGADLIVGSHSHTFQPYEKYKGKYIFYSIGNFCFDDIISDNKRIEIENNRKKSSIVNVIFYKNSYYKKLVPIDFSDLYIKLKYKILREIRIRNYIFKILSKYKLLWKIYYFKLKYINPILFYFLGSKKSFLDKIRGIKIYKIRRYLKK